MARQKFKSHDGVLCPLCNKVLLSWHRHDYRTCECSNETFVDGGFDYMRFGGHSRPTLVRVTTGKRKKIKVGDKVKAWGLNLANQEVCVEGIVKKRIGNVLTVKSDHYPGLKPSKFLVRQVRLVE